MTQYMVIETFADGRLDEVYERFHRHGRMLPKGLHTIDSWLEKDGLRCYQLMETDDRALFDEWMPHWADLAKFEIIEIGAKPEPG